MADNSRFINVASGRRGGKTELSVMWLLANIMQHPEAETAYIAKTYNQASKVFFNKFKRMCPREFLSKKPTESSPQQFNFVNGSVLTLYGSKNYDALRGPGYHYVVMDEVADIPGEAWNEVIRPALSDTMGRCLKIGTPKGRNNWFYDDCFGGECSFYTWTTLEGGIVSKYEVEAAKRQLDEKTFKQEYEASFEALSTLVYYTYSPANYSDVTFNPSLDTVLTFDFNVNPMTCLVNQLQQDGTWVYVKEFIVPNSNSIETTNITAEWLKEQHFNGALSVTGDRTGDSRSVGTIQPNLSNYTMIYEVLKNHGFKCNHDIPRRVKSLNTRINMMNSAFKSATGKTIQYVNNNICKTLDKAFRHMEWTTFSGGYKYDGTSKWSHPCDAATYHAYNYLNNIYETLYE